MATGPHIATDLTWNDYVHQLDPALNAALRWQPKRTLAEQIDDVLRSGRSAREIARAFQADRANRYVNVESSLNSLGYRLLQAGKVTGAIEVFEINTTLYPASGNVYDSLGEAYVAAGKNELALAAYRKAVALDPGNSNAADMVRQLSK